MALTDPVVIAELAQDEKAQMRFVGHVGGALRDVPHGTIMGANRVVVQSADDLPSPVGGRHPLADNTVYDFFGIVTSPHGLELGQNTPIVGRHGSTDGFIHTGGSAALYSRDRPFFAESLYVHAPGGTLFDLVDTAGSEMLVESVSFADAAELGRIASLGTISGFRVPSFKGCNFEDFDGGLTFTGNPDKVFFSESPFRSVTESGVTILTFDASFDCAIVDITTCYVKYVQPDTVVIDVDGSATISEVFQYTGTTHDATVTPSNILTGAAGVGVVGYRVRDCYPLSDSAVVGELAADGSITASTGAAGQDTYTVLDDGATSLGQEAERVSQQSDGVLVYDGKKDVKVHVTASLTVVTGGDTVAAAISKNGTVQATSEMETQSAAGVPVPLSLSSIEVLTTGDTIAVQVKNVDAASDFTVDSYHLSFFG